MKYALVLLFILFFLSSCNKKEDDIAVALDSVIIGKTDYANTLYINYEPDLVLYATIDLKDTVNNNQHNVDNYIFMPGNAEVGLSLYSVCDTKGYYWTKDLVINASARNICVSDTNDAYVRIFVAGEELSLDDAWGLNENEYRDPASMLYNFEEKVVVYEENSQVKDKYLAFKNKLPNGDVSFQWIHISIYNLDSVVIHDAFSTYNY